MSSQIDDMSIQRVIQAAALLWCCFAFSSPSNDSGTLNWLSFEEAVEMTKEDPKLIMVDVYTEWCGWCKRMDATTFKHAEVVAYLKEKFHVVKFDAEQKEDINFQGHKLEFVESGRRGYHQMAYSLLDGKMSYPSVVFLDEKMQRITISPGYQNGPDFLIILKFIGEKAYLNQSFQDFKTAYQSKG